MKLKVVDDPWFMYEYYEIEELLKYPNDHKTLAKWHLLKLYKFYRILKFNLKMLWYGF